MAGDAPFGCSCSCHAIFLILCCAETLQPLAGTLQQAHCVCAGKLKSLSFVMQERAAGLDAVDGMLAAAGGRIGPSVGDLMGALKVQQWVLS